MTMESSNPYRAPMAVSPPATKNRPAPFFGFAALVAFPAAVAAFIAFAACVDFVFGRIPDSIGKGIQLSWLAVTFYVLVGSTIAALVRRERLLWLPLAGWAITATLVAAFAFVLINDYPD
jgi:hypothetical protein